MECTITSGKRRARRVAAFTLVEVMVASAIGTMLLAAVASLSFYSARSFAALANYVDLDQYSRKTLDKMSKEIRQADKIASATTTQLILVQAGVTNLSYTYDASAKTLTRTNGSEYEILLQECDSLTFTLYGRNTVSNSFDQFPTTNAANAKLVKVNWTCSRKILGGKNSESVQSAKIVIRKQDS
jgi:type II secretory pathway component PulJ